MEREVRGITLFSVLWEIMIFGGFISANEFAIKNLIQAYEWLFYFFTAISLLALLFGTSPQYQYTRAKFHWEFVSNTLLGLMLAYYGYFFCASVLTLWGYVSSPKGYFKKEKENGNERTDHQQ